MERDRESQHIERLLAGGYLSGAEYDAIEQQVLRKTLGERRKPARAHGAGIVAALALAAVVVLWLGTPSSFTPKGDAQPASSGGLEVTCGATLEHRCQAGSTLLFLANSAKASGYLGAYAERMDAGVPERIWYFPDAQGASPRLEGAASTQVVGRGIRIGAEHPAGWYRVVVWLTTEPRTRDQIAHLGPTEFVARNVLTIEVVR